MQTRVTTPQVWGGDDLTVRQHPVQIKEYKIGLDLLGADGFSVAGLLLTKDAAEALYAALWAALVDSANAEIDTCDLTEVARMGEGEDGQKPVSG